MPDSLSHAQTKECLAVTVEVSLTLASLRGEYQSNVVEDALNNSNLTYKLFTVKVLLSYARVADCLMVLNNTFDLGSEYLYSVR